MPSFIKIGQRFILYRLCSSKSACKTAVVIRLSHGVNHDGGLSLVEIEGVEIFYCRYSAGPVDHPVKMPELVHSPRGYGGLFKTTYF